MAAIVRKRKWTHNGAQSEAWTVRYYDLKGVRRQRTLRTRREADDFAANTHIDLKKGVHIADRDSVTVSQAGQLWLEDCRQRGLEHFSVKRNEQHLLAHIAPRIGYLRLNQITVPAVNAFKARLRDEGVSKSLARMIVVSLGSIISYAQGEGLTSTNAVRDVARTKDNGSRKVEARADAPVEKGKDFPLPSEVRKILLKTAGRDHAIIAVLAFAGLRSSELRGLRWSDLDLDEHILKVRQRADQRGKIGNPKSKTSRRDIPLLPLVVKALEAWRKKCPLTKTGEKGPDGKPIKRLELVFPNSAGSVEDHHHLERRVWHRAQIAAGITAPAVYKRTGKPKLTKKVKGEQKVEQLVGAKYSGLHSLRHAYASWSLTPREKGGAGVNMKVLQHRMGHSDIGTTMNLYTHLLPHDDLKKEMKEVEEAFWGAK
jgi:integrase